MKIVTLRDGRVRVNEVPKPRIVAPDDVLIKVRYATISPDDLALFWSGNMISGNPYNYGQAGSGVIEELGPAAYRKGLAVGDRVVWFYRANCGMCWQCATGHPLYCPNMTFCTTAFAEFIKWKEAYIYKIPDGLSLEAAVFFQDTLDSIRVFATCGLGAGSSVAILGVNHKSLVMLSFARLCGVRVTALISRNAELLRAARPFGADYSVQFGADDLLALSSRVNKEEGGFSAVIDCAGDTEMLGEAMVSLAYGGTLAVPFSYPPQSMLPLDLSGLYFKEQRLCVLKQSAQGAPKALDVMTRLALDRLISGAGTGNIVPFTNVAEIFSHEFQASHLCGVAEVSEE